MMEPLTNGLVILLFLSGAYLMLGLASTGIERLLRVVAVRPRRARSQTSRTRQRTRPPRPRRKVARPEDAARRRALTALGDSAGLRPGA